MADPAVNDSKSLSKKKKKLSQLIALNWVRKPLNFLNENEVPELKKMFKLFSLGTLLYANKQVLLYNTRLIYKLKIQECF